MGVWDARWDARGRGEAYTPKVPPALLFFFFSLYPRRRGSVGDLSHVVKAERTSLSRGCVFYDVSVILSPLPLKELSKSFARDRGKQATLISQAIELLGR